MKRIKTLIIALLIASGATAKQPVKHEIVYDQVAGKFIVTLYTKRNVTYLIRYRYAMDEVPMTSKIVRGKKTETLTIEVDSGGLDQMFVWVEEVK